MNTHLEDQQIIQVGDTSYRLNCNTRFGLFVNHDGNKRKINLTHKWFYKLEGELHTLNDLIDYVKTIENELEQDELVVSEAEICFLPSIEDGGLSFKLQYYRMESIDEMEKRLKTNEKRQETIRKKKEKQRC